MSEEKEMTALGASVGADAGQSSHMKCVNIIPDSVDNFNGDDDISSDIPDIAAPGYLPVISMSELHDSTFDAKPAVIAARVLAVAGATMTRSADWPRPLTLSAPTTSTCACCARAR